MKNIDLLKKGCKELEIELSDKQADLFLKYLDLLKKWSTKINLTSIKDDKEIITKHFLDSLTLIRFIKSGSNVLDIGSGAGFPGIPVSIVNEYINMSLLEPHEKKHLFTREVKRSLNLKNLMLYQGRAEDEYNNLPRNFFEYVIIRALGSVEYLVSISTDYLKTNGKLILMKGKEDISADTSTYRLKLETIEKFTLPFTDHERSIIVFSK